MLNRIHLCCDILESPFYLSYFSRNIKVSEIKEKYINLPKL